MVVLKVVLEVVALTVEGIFVWQALIVHSLVCFHPMSHKNAHGDGASSGAK